MALRTETSFRSGGERCAAWLYDPGTASPHACVVLAHGFGGTRVARLDAFAQRFADAGLAVLAFDYRHFGASTGEPRQLLDVARQLDDWRAALAFARSLPGVNPDRIALWGTSFSGGHVASIAAENRRVAAAISQNPFLDGIWSLRAGGPANSRRLMAHGLRDRASGRLGRTPNYIPIVGPPGTLAAMTSPDAEPGFQGMFEPGQEYRNEVAARFALQVGHYRPIRRARRITCPWLICVCERDVVTPPPPAAARTADDRVPV
jgi:pimeloyl-ACP methyl ester carboxylesterase